MLPHRPILGLLRVAAALAALAMLHAATADDVIAAADASLSDVQRDEPGSTARAEAIAAALDGIGTLPDHDRLEVQLALAAAWLDGFQPLRCATIAAQVQRDAAADPEQRSRAALARAAAARALLRDGNADAAATLLDEIEQDGDAGPRAAAHLRIARAEIGMALGPDRKAIDASAAMAALDEALVLLRDVPPAERIPVYLLRLTAMERGGAKPAEVTAWLQAHASDPAAVDVAASSVTTGDKLVGQPAPALLAKRLDRPGEPFDLATLRGKPVLIDFFATWCGPCAAVAPAVARFAQTHPEVQVVGVSLDNPQTIADLPAFMAKHAITWPVVGENLGWDGELDDVWHIDSIPSLVLISPTGTIASNDLIGTDGDETVQRLDDALRALNGPPAASEAPFP